jgi:hypothetical protein
MPGSSSILPLLVALAVAGAQVRRPEDLLRRSDVGAFAPSSFRARLAVADAKGRREVEIWRSGEAKTLIRFLDPKERGKYVLQLADQQWLLTTGAKKPVRLKSSYRLYGGATLDEILGVRLSQAYAVESVEEKADAGGKLVVFELRAKSPEMLFPQVRYAVREAAERPVSAVYRLRSGKAATAVEFLEWNEQGAPYARRILLKDLLRRRAPIEVEVLELEELQVPEAVFDLGNTAARRALE